MRKYKRTHVYCQHPDVYEIEGCPNDKGHKTTWSEYEDHLWCFECEMDYIPTHWGIFPGPIPMGLCEMMGISFDRICIKTNKVVSPGFNDEKQMARYKKTWNPRFDKAKYGQRAESTNHNR